MDDFAGAVPILRIFDEAGARDFHLRTLGVKVEFEHRFGPGMPLCMSVRRGACELNLSEHHGDATPGSAVRIGVADTDGFRTDPSGNRVIFWQDAPA